MASHYESRASQLRREIETLHRRIGDETTAVATAREKALRANDSARGATSTTTAQSRLRDAARHNKDAHQHEKRRGDCERQLATKIKDLYAAEKHIREDQQRDQEKAAREQREALRRLQQSSHQRLADDRAALTHRLQIPDFSREVLHADTNSERGAIYEPEYDVFISHASEDKDEVARPLAERLMSRGLRVWYDEFVLQVGDSLRRKIDQGLARSRFGIVILSPPFFDKEWPNRELDGLAARQTATGEKIVLPLWHHVSKDDVIRYSPPLADTVALRTADMTLDEIAEQLADMIVGSH